MISQRAKSIDSSGIRRVFDLAANLENPINLSIGSPSFDASAELKKSAIEAIKSGKNGYTVTQGIPELRQQILQKYSLDEGSDKGVFVSSGVSGGLFLAYCALLDPGDEILIPDPFFCMYRDLAYLINAKPVYYDTYPSFSLSPVEIAKSITPKTKAILVNSPGNPTGYALSKNELNQVVEIAREAGLWLIYDEIYEAYCYDMPHVSCLRDYEKVILLNGFSKSHGIPGWRIGYALGSKEVIGEMAKIQQYSFVCAPSFAQVAVATTVTPDFSKQLEEYRGKRDFIYHALRDVYDVEKPGGAFYIFPKAPGGSGDAFVEKCIANNLLVVPGSVFSTKDSHFRISFSAPQETLEKGVEILLRLVKN